MYSGSCQVDLHGKADGSTLVLLFYNEKCDFLLSFMCASTAVFAHLFTSF